MPLQTEISRAELARRNAASQDRRDAEKAAGKTE